MMYLMLILGCAAPEQPITAYRETFARIHSLHVQQAEIENLVLYEGGYLTGLSGK